MTKKSKNKHSNINRNLAGKLNKTFVIALKIAFWTLLFPFAVGKTLLVLTRNKIRHPKLKSALSILIVLLSITFGASWVYAITTSPINEQSNSVKTQESTSKPSDNKNSKTEIVNDKPNDNPNTENNKSNNNSQKEPNQEPVKTSENKNYYKVTNVVDGDTIDVDINGKIERLRLIGIDTPETKDPRKPVQCFGKEASSKASEMLSGKKVSLEADAVSGERDKYNRLLRYVFIENGTFYNKEVIAQGYAHEYTYQSQVYKYQTEFKQAEKDARENSRGLWSLDSCNGDTAKPATSNSPTATGNVTGVVKMSRTKICHAPSTTYYEKTTNFTPYGTLQECLDAGGRLPKR